MTSTQNTPVGVPRRHSRQGSVISTPNKSSILAGYPNIKKIRPYTPDSLASEDSDKLTSEQHDCIQNMGLAAAFFLPIALVTAFPIQLPWPITPESLASNDSGKLTIDQHICIQNLGMAAAFFLPLALIGAAVAIGTNYWFNVDGHYVGMFVFCNNWTQECSGIRGLYGNHTLLKNIWTYGVPLEVGGAGMLLLGMLTLVCYPCHRRVNFSKVCCGVTVGLVLLLGVLAFVGGTVLFLYYKLNESPSPGLEWSFYLNGGSAIFAVIAVILFWIHVFYTGCFDMN